MVQEKLGDVSGGHHNDKGNGDDDGHVSRKGSPHFIPGFNESYGGGNKQDRHDEKQKGGYLADIFQCQYFSFQQQEQEYDTINAGGYGEGDQGVEHFSQKRKKNDDGKLFKFLHSEYS